MERRRVWMRVSSEAGVMDGCEALCRLVPA